MNATKRGLLTSGVLACSLLATVAGNASATTSNTAAGEGTTPAVAPVALPAASSLTLAEGEVFVSGSSTVEPISAKVSELAEELTDSKLAVTVEGPGTGDGFKKFCAGESDISDASRKIKDEEAKTCADAGIEYIELEIAIDGLTVATNPKNTAVECLDVPALYALIGPESEGFQNWKDGQALATELGSKVQLPDAPLSLVGPGPESGTYDTFVEFAIAKLAKSREKEDKTRSDYTQSPNDNVIVEGIEGSDTSLGWVGFAYYAAEMAKMKAIGIDAGEGCVVPTHDTIADGTYPFSRSLYIYVSKKSLAENPAVKSYVDLYLSAEGMASVAEAGYVDLPNERLAATVDTWAKG